MPFRHFAAAAALAASAMALAAVPASAAPSSFPASVTTRSSLVTSHPVYTGEAVIVRGREYRIASVAHPGPYAARIAGQFPAGLAGTVITVIAAP